MEFTKADLRNWDIVVTRKGMRYFVDTEKGMYRGVDTFTWMDNYDINLKSTHEPRNDIMKVYRDAGCYILSELDAEVIDDEWIIYNRNEKWQPKVGDKYYIPRTSRELYYDELLWEDDSYDNRMLERNIVFKTKEEAIKVAKKMLKALEEEK